MGTRDPQMRRCVARTIAMLILEFMKFEVAELDFPDFLRGFMQGFVVLGFMSKHSVTRNHKGREVTALVQAA